MSLGDGGLTSSSEVDAYVEQVVSRIRTTPPKESGEPAECPALDLGPLLLRLPGETWHWKRIWKSGKVECKRIDQYEPQSSTINLIDYFIILYITFVSIPGYIVLRLVLCTIWVWPNLFKQRIYGIGSQISGTHSIYFGVGRCFVWFWMVLTCAEPPSEFAVSDSKSGRSRDVKRPRRIATDHPFSGHFGVQLAACSMLRGEDQNSNWNSSYTHPISLLYCVNTRHGNET